ncbi:hypothetical protein AB0I60_05670 [Actinosynnema sp. NPDC050436]|uniref:hypothetical protein n=1 Tax=Actinosynnema sp. NPDC050436 TaxID=3155659 RepID=UPI0033DC5733
MSGRRRSGFLRSAGSLAVLVVLTAGVTAPAATAAPLTITVLGALPGDIASAVEDLNEAGTVIGRSLSAKAADGTWNERAVRWSPEGTITALPLPAGVPRTAYSKPVAINDAGFITGYARYGPAGGYEYRALRWAPNGKVTELKPLPGDMRATPKGISRNGTVAGESYDVNGEHHAVKWALDGTVTTLSPLPGSTGARVHFINANNMVVGISEGGGSPSHAVKWDPDGTVKDLHPFIGVAYAVNDAGVISGWNENGHGSRLDPNGTVADFGRHGYTSNIGPDGTVVGCFYISVWATTAMRWAPDGTPTTLPGLPTHNNSRAVNMNASGTVVGHTSRTEQMNFVETSAVKWSPDGTITVLDTLPGSKHSSAAHINSAGTIAGTAENADENSHAVVWRS